MLKRLELSDPQSCFNKAHDDEPIFVLLGRDVAAPGAIEYWITERCANRKNKAHDEQLHEAEEISNEMRRYAVVCAVRKQQAENEKREDDEKKPAADRSEAG